MAICILCSIHTPKSYFSKHIKKEITIKVIDTPREMIQNTFFFTFHIGWDN